MKLLQTLDFQIIRHSASLFVVDLCFAKSQSLCMFANIIECKFSAVIYFEVYSSHRYILINDVCSQQIKYWAPNPGLNIWNYPTLYSIQDHILICNEHLPCWTGRLKQERNSNTFYSLQHSRCTNHSIIRDFKQSRLVTSSRSFLLCFIWSKIMGCKMWNWNYVNRAPSADHNDVMIDVCASVVIRRSLGPYVNLVGIKA